MAKIVREIPITRLDAQNDPKFAYQQSLRDDDKQILSALNLKMNSEAVKTTDVFTNLAPQAFKMAGVTADDARVSSSGASVSTAFSVTGTKIIISNVDFVSTIAIGATSTVIFLGCRFKAAIAVASGGKAVFNGCVFQDSGYVNNLGAPGNVGLIGTIKTSATAHTNVTDIFSV
jgi:hypothetical protein